MRRLTLLATAFCLATLTACYTQIKQTRAPVSADCNSWPAAVDEGSSLTLGLGQVGRYEDLKILFSDLDLNAGRYRPLDYGYPYWWGYPGPVYPGSWGRPAGWWPAPAYGPSADVVYLSVCAPGGVPVDRKFYLSDSPWMTRNETDVGPYTIAIERLQLKRSGTPGDSLRGEDYWSRNAHDALVTLTVTRNS